MKQPYEKPKMVIERIEFGALAEGGSPGGNPIPQLQPFFGLCPPCQ